MNPINTLLFGIFLLAGVVYLYLGVYLIYENVHEFLNRIFSIVALALTIWAFSFAMALAAPDYANALFWRRISSIGWGSFYAIMLHFIIALLMSSSVTKKKYILSWYYLILYVPAFITVYAFGISSSISTHVYKFIQTGYGWRNIALKSSWDIFFNVYYISYSLVGILLLITLGRYSKLIREKKQSIIITASFIICFIAGSLTDIVLDYFTNVKLPESGIIFLLIPITAIWVSIKKYGLMKLSLGSIAEDVLSKMNECLLVMDYKRTVIKINNSMEVLTGYSLEEMKMEHLFESLDSLWKDLLIRDFDGVEINIIVKNMKAIPVLLSSTRIIDQYGELEGIVCIITNMWDIKERERVLVKTQKDLEAALQKANVDAKVKSQFIANISHEIRTPMNSIIGMSYLTLQTNLNNQQKEYLDKIQSSAEQLLNIVNDVLNFSKMEDGKMELEQIEFDVDGLIVNEINKIVKQAHEKQLKIIYNYNPKEKSIVIGDLEKLAQIFSNLLSNAIKFTEHGEIEVTVKEKLQKKNEVCYEFSIRDTGIGMTKDNISTLFNAFTQIDGSTTRQYGGTGLGLAIAKGLIEMMNGKIWVESQLGIGSRFIFILSFPKSLSANKFREDKNFLTCINKQNSLNTKVIDEDKSILQIKSLLNYLKSGNGLSIDLYNELRDFIMSRLSDSDFIYVDRKMAAYEFDEAYERLSVVLAEEGLW